MNVIDIMKRPAAYASGYENIPGEEQNRAKQLCWEYNRTAPKEQRKRREILQELLGHEEDCELLTGWRYRVVGKELSAFLNGEFSLRLDDGNLVIDRPRKSAE